MLDLYFTVQKSTLLVKGVLMKHLFILSALIFACDDHKFSGGHGSETPVEGSGYEAVQTIFSNSCAGCHAQGSTPPALDGDLCIDIRGDAR